MTPNSFQHKTLYDSKAKVAMITTLAFTPATYYILWLYIICVNVLRCDFTWQVYVVEVSISCVDIQFQVCKTLELEE